MERVLVLNRKANNGLRIRMAIAWRDMGWRLRPLKLDNAMRADHKEQLCHRRRSNKKKPRLSSDNKGLTNFVSSSQGVFVRSSYGKDVLTKTSGLTKEIKETTKDVYDKGAKGRLTPTSFVSSRLSIICSKR